jgi:hypothetical protein
VDDGIITGSERMTLEAIEGFNQVFKVKVESQLKTFWDAKLIMPVIF